MRKPRIPPMIVDIVQTALTACDGTYFDSRDACPSCGGSLSGYDKKKKQFAIILAGEVRRPVHVIVKRFACHSCRKVWFADEPFYPGTRTGSPVVDLCRTLSAAMPFSRAAVYLEEVGVAVDRMSVRNFSHIPVPDITVADVFGVPLPMSIVSLSTFAAGLREGECLGGADVLTACGFPSAFHGSPAPRATGTNQTGDDDDTRSRSSTG